MPPAEWAIRSSWADNRGRETDAKQEVDFGRGGI